MPTPRPDPGSFRDPSSRVFLSDDRVLRALDEQAALDLTAAAEAPFFTQATRAGTIVPTTLLDEAPAAFGITGPWAAVAEHPRLPLWTYPYEWSFSMLRDAAILQLDVLAAALADGFICKDATPYNVQFEGTSATFVDVGSFERLTPGDPWYGYLQFCQMFLYPLLFQAYADLPFQPWLRASIDGITPEEARRVLGPTRLARKGVAVHVALHAMAQRRLADAKADIKTTMKQSGFNSRLIEANVKGLQKLVGGLEWKRSESTWSSYSDRSHYSDRELRAKEAFVVEVASRSRCSLVWDVGCNDGHFSELVAAHAAHVLAFDNDHLVVDVLYRRLREAKTTNVVPLVVNLADPPAGLGWRGQERRGFLDRNRPDLVLCLAVVHHLAITSNVPTAEFLDVLVSLGAEAIVEFPTEDDPMVKRLLRNKRAGVHDGYALATFEEQVAERFNVERRLELDGGTRVLFDLLPR
ncbi:MAG: methyltransferase [Actinobacteria bacterium]|nr:methyltransferase [Actinomycetota bacterium]